MSRLPAISLTFSAAGLAFAVLGFIASMFGNPESRVIDASWIMLGLAPALWIVALVTGLLAERSASPEHRSGAVLAAATAGILCALSIILVVGSLALLLFYVVVVAPEF